MNRIWLFALAGFAIGCCGTIATAAQKSATGPWNDVATREVRTLIDKEMDAIAAMDSATVLMALGDDVSGFDIDVEGKPVRMGSRAESIRYFEDIFEWARKAGATLKIDRHATVCHATSTMAFCSLEYDFMVTMPDGSKVSQPTRTTIVLQRLDAGWKWVHWHSSLSVLSTPQAPPTGK